MPTSKLRLPSLLVLVAALGVALSGCAGSEYPAFDHEQTAEDELPADFSVPLDEYDLSTLRSAGTHEDVDYFIIRMKDEADAGGPCLVIDDPVGAVIGCGLGPLTVNSVGHAAVLAAAGVPAGEAKGWTRISENVTVRDAR
jgi:hypothetical protein